MVLNKQIIEFIKSKSGLSFDKAKDYDALCDSIFSVTNRTIGINTIKRLMGYIVDDRNTNLYTLNTIAIYLNFENWEELCQSLRVDSSWNFDDHTIYVDELPIDTKLTVKYLNRIVTFNVVLFKDEKMLEVVEAHNSSLQSGDILKSEYLRVNEPLEARTVYRGDVIGNYKTNSELTEIISEHPLI